MVRFATLPPTIFKWVPDMLIAFPSISTGYSHIPHHPTVLMGLKCEPPSLVLVMQIHELNGRSDTSSGAVARLLPPVEF
jgi:hypothetical protein